MKIFSNLIESYELSGETNKLVDFTTPMYTPMHAHQG